MYDGPEIQDKPQKQTQIPMRIEQLNTVLDQLEKQVIDLGDRLACVSKAPGPPTAEKSPKDQEMCLIERDLFTIYNRLDAVIIKIRMITADLEI